MAQSEALDERLITHEVLLLEVLQKLAALSDHNEKAAAAVEVLLVLFHVGRQLADTRREDRHLHLCGIGVRVVGLILFDYRLFFLFLDHFDHSILSLLRSISLNSGRYKDACPCKGLMYIIRKRPKMASFLFEIAMPRHIGNRLLLFGKKFH